MPYYAVRVDKYHSGKRHLEIRGGPYENRAQAEKTASAMQLHEGTAMSTFEVWSEADLKSMANTGVEVHDTMGGRW